MAVITNSTFNPLKARCNVRLQQGVPIVDADWNELDDIRKFEMRAYLKWFVGDGIPDGSDAFRVEALAAPTADDFKINAGMKPAPPGTGDFDKGLSFAGRAIVDGLDILIPADINYKAQPLFTAAAFGVPKIAPMPNGAGAIAVYLDVWERLVTSQEDASLVLPGVGTESCARVKREWCVRTRPGQAAPQPGDGEFIAGHSYYLLAVILRTANGANIAAADVQDRRRLKLTLAALEARLTTIEQLLLVPRFNPSPNQFQPKLGFAGNNITLFGTNFNLGTVVVRFGATQANVQGVPTPNQIFVQVPPSLAPGPVKVTVQTTGGSVTSTDEFKVIPTPAPAWAASPNQFNPKIGPPGSITQLFGTNLNIAPVTVRFGTTDADVTGVAGDGSHLSVRVPSLLPGAVKITIQTGGGSVTSTDNFTVPAPAPPTFNPSPNQFNPKSGPPGTDVTLLGNALSSPQVTVRFGATDAVIVGDPLPTQVFAKVPALPAGKVKITIKTGGGSVVSVDDFTVT